MSVKPKTAWEGEEKTRKKAKAPSAKEKSAYSRFFFPLPHH
jgi:hypothetical protein